MFTVISTVFNLAVSEITVAGNLLDTYQSFVEVGNDLDKWGNTITGSILLEQMTVAGE